jgi:DNA-binding NarL/FixJ family response regulator
VIAMSAVRILIADDHELTRRGVQVCLESQPEWKVVGEAATGHEAVEKARALKPDVVILDISMPQLSGLETARQILKAVPQAEIAILTMHDSEALVRRALEAGARAFVTKSDVAHHLIDAVNALRQHRAFFTSAAAATVLESYLSGSGKCQKGRAFKRDLTPREEEVLQLLAEGRSNKEIASILQISIFTAETHRGKIMRKLNLHSMNEIVRYAIRNQLLGALA